MSENNSEQKNIRGILDEVISEAGDSTPNAPEKVQSEDAEKARRDDALFKSIEAKKKKKRRRTIRRVIIIVAILAAAGFTGVSYLRRRVQIKSASSLGDVQHYAATVGSVSTTVSGSGTLANVVEEVVNIPEGIEIEDVVVKANDKVEAGDVIAELDMATVRSAIASVQTEIDDLDDQIYDASTEKLDDYINAGLRGRVKAIYAEEEMSVADCMVEHGCLALLSLDRKMAVSIPAEHLKANDTVTVIRSNEKKTELEGTVESVTGGTAVILVDDDGPELDEEVTVTDTDGKTLGSGKLTIHKPLKITGISGKIGRVCAVLNRTAYKGDNLFYLKETGYTAKYESLLKKRADKEELLMELMRINRDGALLAPFAGSVSAVLYDDGDDAADSASSASASSMDASASMMSSFGMMSMYGMSGYSSAAASTASSSASSAASEEGKVDIVKLSPDEMMEVTISVDESNILALEVGQNASITVNSIGEDSFEGVVTEIDKTATSASGVTRYSATVTVSKEERMLPGMRAKAVIRIQGVDNTIIIPVDALHQTSSTSYVYTTYDDELGEYGGLVEVVPGISNSNYVEIISGLNEGDVVYYVKSGNVFDMMMNMAGMGGGMPGMGARGGRG